ncbi:MAG: hypothetical protein Q7R57_08765, partial [Dehalococcoidales bacterium]|nr:hypothetical protein [Dehalococcoidales bacterium]
ETNPNYSNLFGKIERRFLLGGYPEGTINFLVDKKMKDNAARLRQFYSPADEEKKDGQKKEAVVKADR